MNQQHDNIWQSNVPRFVSRCSCLVFHEVGWSSIACSKRLLVTRSWDCLHHHQHRCLKCFYLLAFWAREKIFSWRCDSHFQGEMRRGDGATVLSGATIATNSHLQDTSWWVGPGWAGGGWWWCWSDDAEEEDEILKNWNRDFLYGNWYFKCQILKFSCLVVYYWTFNLGEGPFALALTTYIFI